MPDRFVRSWKVTVGDVDVSSLDMSFSVMRSVRREPNTAEVSIHNLAPDTRGRLVATSNPRLVLRAGYVSDGDPPPTLFVGDAREVHSEPEVLGWVTKVSARDGGRAFRHSRMLKSYGEGTRVLQVLRDAAEALGVGEGNLAELEPFVVLQGGAQTFPDGYVASGPAHRVLNSIVRGAGLRWSVQNNAIQIMRRGRPLETQIVLLSSSTGLVDYPAEDEKGTVTARCLIQPGLDPGRRVRLDSEIKSGDFEIRKVVYSGDTMGTEWYATLELRASA